MVRKIFLIVYVRYFVRQKRHLQSVRVGLMIQTVGNQYAVTSKILLLAIQVKVYWMFYDVVALFLRSDCHTDGFSNFKEFNIEKFAKKDIF